MPTRVNFPPITSMCPLISSLLLSGIGQFWIARYYLEEIPFCRYTATSKGAPAGPPWSLTQGNKFETSNSRSTMTAALHAVRTVASLIVNPRETCCLRVCSLRCSQGLAAVRLSSLCGCRWLSVVVATETRGTR
jgi:hypothetical protein